MLFGRYCNCPSCLDWPQDMKILCVIDSLGSGGAQRQMVNLASGLKAKGHHVELFIYHPGSDFYRSIINQAAITLTELTHVSGFSFRVVLSLARLLRKGRFDVLISFLPSPNVYSVFASLCSFSKVNLIVSERSSSDDYVSTAMLILRRGLYARAQGIVVNSFDQAAVLNRYPWLKSKISVIYNGYNFDCKVPNFLSFSKSELSLIVVGRITSVKNGVRLLHALLLLKKEMVMSQKCSGPAGKRKIPNRYRYAPKWTI